MYTNYPYISEIENASNNHISLIDIFYWTRYKEDEYDWRSSLTAYFARMQIPLTLILSPKGRGGANAIAKALAKFLTVAFCAMRVRRGPVYDSAKRTHFDSMDF
jgi:hypothetical protein